jgi:hypothetical protein
MEADVPVLRFIRFPGRTLAMKTWRGSFAVALVALVALVVGAATAPAADLTDSLKKGTPDIKSISTMTFGPEGILFLGDPKSAAIFAVATEDTKASDAKGKLELTNLNQKVASLLGIEASKLTFNDLAVNPASTNAYVAVSRGSGQDAMPVLLRVDRGNAKLSEVPLKDVKFAKVELPNATERQRQEAITCMAYLQGKLYVAGLSNEEFSSTLRAIPFPFKEADKGAGIEIFHGAHGRFETRSPVRTFTTMNIKGETHLLAAYTCTPLVKIPVSELKAGAKVKGTTVAELGNRNKPLDMVVYEKGGKTYILIANSSRGVMKVTTEGIDKIEPIVKPVRGGTGTAGLTYDKISDLKGVEQLAKLDDTHALVLVRGDGGALNLSTIDLP